MIDIFLSYAHEDVDRVQPLIKSLEMNGWTIWWDTDIEPGHLFDMEIEKAIESARCVLVVWSRYSINSQWVRSEAHEGLDRNILVPVLIDEVRPPLPFRQIQSLELLSPPLDIDTDFTDLITAIEGTLNTDDANFNEKTNAAPEPGQRNLFNSKRRNLFVLIGLISIAIALFFYWDFRQEEGSFSTSNTDHQILPVDELAFDARDWIVLASFQNLTNNPVFDESLGLALRIGLGQSRYVNVVQVEQLRDTLKRMKLPPETLLSRDTAIELALRERAKAVIAAGITEIGNVYALNAEIINPATGDSVYVKTIGSLGQDKILVALDEMCKELRSHLGESISSIEESTVPLERVTTSDLDALKAYSLGIERLASGQIDEGIVLLEWAMDRDPEFAMAYAKLGAIYSATKGDLDKSSEYWSKALEFSHRLTDREKLYVEASSSWQKSPAEMIQAWSLMSNLYPDEAVGHHNLGLVYWNYENLLEEAEVAFEKASRIRHPWNFLSLHMLGYVRMGLGDLDGSLQAYQEALGRSSNQLELGMADMYIATRRYDEAQQLLSSISPELPPAFRFRGKRRSVAFHVDQGSFSRSVDVARELLEESGSGDYPGEELRSAAALLAVMEVQENKELFWGILDKYTAYALAIFDGGEVSSTIPVVEQLALLGKIAARNGGIDRAETIFGKIQPASVNSGFYFREALVGLLQAEIYLAQGKTSEALQLARQVSNRRELFQAHETLARIYRQNGQLEEAIEEYTWIIDHRGRAFGENMSKSFGKEFNVVDWALAHYHRAQLFEELGEQARAMTDYQLLRDYWESTSDDLPVLVDIKNKLSMNNNRGQQ